MGEMVIKDHQWWSSGATATEPRKPYDVRAGTDCGSNPSGLAATAGPVTCGVEGALAKHTNVGTAEAESLRRGGDLYAKRWCNPDIICRGDPSVECRTVLQLTGTGPLQQQQQQPFERTYQAR